MISNDKLRKLVALVAEFEKLDASIPNAINNNEWTILDQALAKKKEIKRILSECDPLSVERGLGNKLKKIRDNYGYTIDRVLEVLGKVTGETISQESEAGIDIADALFSEGRADYVDEGFFTRRNEVSTLILIESIPNHFLQHFRNLRECYALGLFETTTIYCRALIETGCFEALRRKGQVRLDANVKDIREYSLKELMRSVKTLVCRDNWNKADTVIKKADHILHSKREATSTNQNDAYAAIKDTFAIIEELFSGGRQKAAR